MLREWLSMLQKYVGRLFAYRPPTDPDTYDVGEIDRRLDVTERRQREIAVRLRLLEVQADPRKVTPSEWYAGDGDDPR